MPEDTKLKTCSNCAVWGTEYRLANRTTSCAGLGFDSNDTCDKWTAPFQALVRVREPSLAQILQEKDLRDPWKELRTKLASTTAYYNKEDGYYYYFFEGQNSLQEAEKFAATLSADHYVQKSQGRIMPLRFENMEEEDKGRFQQLAKVAKAE